MNDIQIKNDPDFEYKRLNTRELFVDSIYQRPLNDSKVKAIVRDYSPYLVNAIKVSYRDGKYWIFDGQHTAEALKRVHKGNDCMVECKVFYGLTRLDEMKLFIKQNGHSSGVNLMDKFKALYNMGDEEITDMVRLVEKAGLYIDFKKGNKTNKIVAVKVLYDSYRSMPPGDFLDVMRMIRETWDGSPDSLLGEIIGGVSRFHMAYRGDYSHAAFVKRLKRKSPVEIIRDGKVSSVGGMNRYARVILHAYNMGTTSKRLDDRL